MSHGLWRRKKGSGVTVGYIGLACTLSVFVHAQHRSETDLRRKSAAGTKMVQHEYDTTRTLYTLQPCHSVCSSRWLVGLPTWRKLALRYSVIIHFAQQHARGCNSANALVTDNVTLHDGMLARDSSGVVDHAAPAAVSKPQVTPRSCSKRRLLVRDLKRHFDTYRNCVSAFPLH